MPAKNETTTRFRVDISDLKKGIQDANREIKLANSEFKAASAGMDNWAKSADGVSAKITSLEKTLNAQTKVLSLYQDELEAVKKEYGENSKEAQEMQIKLNNQQAAVNKTAKELSDYRNTLSTLQAAEEAAADGAAEQAKQTDKLGDSLDEVEGDAKKASDGFTTMKGVLADLASSAIKSAVSGLKDLGKAALDAWGNFDDGIDTIIKATGATGDAVAGFEQSFVNVSKRIVGDGATIGGAIGEINTRFGFTGQQLEDATVAFMQFSEITGSDTVGAVQNVSKALNAAGYEASEYQRVLDALALAGQASGVSVDKVADGLNKYGTQARALGLDIEDLVALFAQFELSGVNTETALAGISKATQTWAKDGKDAAKEFQIALAQIKTAPNQTKAAEKAIETFGTKAGPELAEAIKSGRFAFEDFAKAIRESGGTVERTFEETQDAPDKLALAMQSLKTDVAQTTNEIMQEIGPDLEQLLKDVSKLLTKDVIPAVKNAIQFFLKNKDAIIAGLKGIAAGILALKVANIINALVTSFKAFKAAQDGATLSQWALNAAMNANPIGLIIAGITAIVVAFKALWDNCEGFREFWITLWEMIKDAAGAAWEAITGFFSTAWEFITGAFAGAGEFFAGIWGNIKDAFAAVGSWFSETFGAAWGAITEIFGSIGSWFEERWKDIKKVFAGISGFFRTVFEGARDAIRTIWNTVSGLIKAPINALIDLLNVFIRGVNKIKIPDWVWGIGGYGIHIPEIPNLARGGVLARGQVGLLEGDGAEAVVPLENNRRWIAATARDLKAALQGEGIINGRGGVNNYYSYTQNNTSPKALSRLEIYRQTKNQLAFAKGGGSV